MVIKKRILPIIIVTMLMALTMPFGVTNAEEIPAADVTVSTWADLQSEITNATSPRVIKLGSDIVAPDPATNSSISVPSGKNITIDLNGHVLDRGLIANDGTTTAKDSVIGVAGTLTIVDGDPNAEHKGTLTESGYFWNWDDGANTGDTIIKGGIITGGCRSGNYNGGSGIRVGSGANLTMKGGTVAGNKSLSKAHAGGVYVIGTFNMMGGEIKYNSANLHGGGIFIRDGAFIMDGSAKITKNIVSSNGGGIYLMTGTFTMNGGEISYNKGNLGGGVRTESDGMTMTGGIIKNNIATGDGGGIRGGVIIMTGGEITGNTATGNGGGLYAGAVTLGGAAKITGNLKGSTANNLFLGADKTITISTDSLPTANMNIGVTTAVAPIVGTPVAITSNGNAGDEAYFNSDNPDYYVLNRDNILKLVKDGNPTGEISFQENSFNSFLSSITFGLFFNDKFDVVINASDDIELKTVEYYISDKQLSEDEVKAITNWKTYSKFAIESNDKYVIYAKITDSVNNVTYISSDGFVLDTVAPVINGLSYGDGFYYVTQRFTVEEDYLDKVRINDVETTDYILPGNTFETYEIDAIDKAGNPTYLSIRMMPLDTIAMLLDEYDVESVTLEDKEDIEYVKEKTTGINATYATDSEKEELQEIIDKCNLLLKTIKDKYMPEEDPNTEENPNTGDNIISFLIIGSVSLIGVVGCGLYLGGRLKHLA